MVLNKRNNLIKYFDQILSVGLFPWYFPNKDEEIKNFIDTI